MEKNTKTTKNFRILLSQGFREEGKSLKRIRDVAYFQVQVTTGYELLLKTDKCEIISCLIG